MRRWALKLLGLGLLAALMVASAHGDAVTRAADRLVAQQERDGSWTDYVQGQPVKYTGSIVAGLVNAYEMTGTEA